MSVSIWNLFQGSNIQKSYLLKQAESLNLHFYELIAPDNKFLDIYHTNIKLFFSNLEEKERIDKFCESLEGFIIDKKPLFRRVKVSYSYESKLIKIEGNSLKVTITQLIKEETEDQYYNDRYIGYIS